MRWSRSGASFGLVEGAEGDKDVAAELKALRKMKRDYARIFADTVQKNLLYHQRSG
jgi:hypothetical protein